MKTKKILLIGDVILDVYIYSKIVGRALYDKRALEVEEEKTATSFGGNGLVAKNILELGGNLTFISVIGKDAPAGEYDNLRHPKLRKRFLIDKSRRTIVKKRWFAGNRALLQANQVDNHDITAELERKLKKLIDLYIRNVDVVVVMDPQHGLLTKGIIKYLVETAKKNKKPLYVDAQISHRASNHHLYKGADCMFLNEKEARAVYPQLSIDTPMKSLKAIKKKLRLNNVVLKLGARGSIALLNDKFIQTKPHKVRAIDVAGAGDAFLAAFSMGDPQQPEKSLKEANIWAALSTTIHGTIPPRKKDFIKSLKKSK